MLRAMRDVTTGRPSLRIRVLAAVVVIGLLALAAPVMIPMIGPVLHWLATAIL